MLLLNYDIHFHFDNMYTTNLPAEVSFTKKYRTSCRKSKYNKFSSLQGAQNECIKDDNCSRVYDRWCDGNTWYLCPHGSIVSFSLFSCTYLKEGTFRKYIGQLVLFREYTLMPFLTYIYNLSLLYYFRIGFETEMNNLHLNGKIIIQAIIWLTHTYTSEYRYDFKWIPFSKGFATMFLAYVDYHRCSDEVIKIKMCYLFLTTIDK